MNELNTLLKETMLKREKEIDYQLEVHSQQLTSQYQQFQMIQSQIHTMEINQAEMKEQLQRLNSVYNELGQLLAMLKRSIT